ARRRRRRSPGARVRAVESDAHRLADPDHCDQCSPSTLTRCVLDMAAAELGPWRPMPLNSVVAVFDGAPFRWWISGGLALELHLGRSWRTHDDTDIGVVRADVPRLASVLHSWDIRVAAAGQLT